MVLISGLFWGGLFWGSHCGPQEKYSPKGASPTAGCVLLTQPSTQVSAVFVGKEEAFARAMMTHEPSECEDR